MKKHGFTLVEILVAVVLLGLISMFISSTILQTKKNNRLFEKQTKKELRLEVVADTLYKDISESVSISVDTQNRYSTLHVKSKNSLYGIFEPYVVWFVLKQDNTLVRLESARQIKLPIKQEEKKYIFVDIVTKNCTDFSINLATNKTSVLSFLSVNKSTKVLFETLIY